MSVPWGWLGSFFTWIEGTTSLSVTGSGTASPILWTNTPDESGKGAPGSTAASEIVAFELTTAQLTFTASGTVTLGFTNPLDPSDFQYATAPFSVTAVANASLPTGYKGTGYSGSGTPPAWDVNESTVDYLSAGASIIGGNSGGMSFTLPWGTQTGAVEATIILENLYAIIGSEDGNGYPTKYTKDLELQLEGIGDATSHETVVASTDINTDLMDDPLTNDFGAQSLLHVPSSAAAAAHLFWGTEFPGAAMTLASCSLTVTEQYTQPADLA